MVGCFVMCNAVEGLLGSRLRGLGFVFRLGLWTLGSKR